MTLTVPHSDFCDISGLAMKLTSNGGLNINLLVILFAGDIQHTLNVDLVFFKEFLGQLEIRLIAIPPFIAILFREPNYCKAS